jgi:hypothetical protein
MSRLPRRLRAGYHHSSLRSRAAGTWAAGQRQPTLRRRDEGVEVLSAYPVGKPGCAPLPGRLDLSAPDWIQLLTVPGTTCSALAPRQAPPAPCSTWMGFTVAGASIRSQYGHPSAPRQTKRSREILCPPCAPTLHRKTASSGTEWDRTGATCPNDFVGLVGKCAARQPQSAPQTRCLYAGDMWPGPLPPAPSTAPWRRGSTQRREPRSPLRPHRAARRAWPRLLLDLRARVEASAEAANAR